MTSQYTNPPRGLGLRLATVCVAAAMAFAAPGVRAQTQAYTSEPVDLFAGPSDAYPVVSELGPNVPVTVMGCVSDYSWCDVALPGLRGWVYAEYLSYPYQGAYVPLTGYGAAIGLPIVTFSVGAYWGSFYRDRPWYGDRDRWTHAPPPVRGRPPEPQRFHGGPPGGEGRPPPPPPPGGARPPVNGAPPPRAGRPPEPARMPPGNEAPSVHGRPPESGGPPVAAPRPPGEMQRPPVEGARPPGEMQRPPVEGARPPVESPRPPAQAVNPSRPPMPQPNMGRPPAPAPAQGPGPGPAPAFTHAPGQPPGGARPPEPPAERGRPEAPQQGAHPSNQGAGRGDQRQQY
ncbi:SH3 domain-containing protein [Paraburkholderia sacchari]|uniref:Peptide-binding protein n=1 Tax=Paraburkholderia sacchari TaxID=159450 RepID=A0A8T6ZHG7_9BURK|nr:SH3 domain-containing protein [Paraburkholderia sacchari]NLP64667.1 peptide-binding protein [Paraburkholderia sacchari]